MTIPKACQLVLEASFMGEGVEIFVFDRGEPVKIYDLAEKMIYLSGFIPREDIKIEVTSLWPGEKLFEELLRSWKNRLSTHNEIIRLSKTKKHNYNKVNQQITRLIACVNDLDNQTLVDYMREIAPEFISQNSYYINNPLLPENRKLPA